MSTGRREFLRAVAVAPMAAVMMARKTDAIDFPERAAGTRAFLRQPSQARR
jgi:hypothetical protein